MPPTIDCCIISLTLFLYGFGHTSDCESQWLGPGSLMLSVLDIENMLLFCSVVIPYQSFIFYIAMSMHTGMLSVVELSQ